MLSPKTSAARSLPMKSAPPMKGIYPLTPSTGCAMNPGLKLHLGPKTTVPLGGLGFRMRLNDDARKCVVFFGVPTTDGIKYGGTGFMVTDDEDGIKIPFIVTCRHVAKALEKHADTGFYLRANRIDGG